MRREVCEESRGKRWRVCVCVCVLVGGGGEEEGRGGDHPSAALATFSQTQREVRGLEAGLLHMSGGHLERM